MATLKNIGLLFLLPFCWIFDTWEKYGAYCTFAGSMVSIFSLALASVLIGLGAGDYEGLSHLLDWGVRSAIYTCFSFSLWVAMTWPTMSTMDKVWMGITAGCGLVLGSMWLYFYLV